MCVRHSVPFRGEVTNSAGVNDHAPPHGVRTTGQHIPMTSRRAVLAGTAIGFALGVAGAPVAARAQQAGAVAAPAIDADDIGGVVTSRMGPESGVWVVAETTGLGTRFAKMAVTDDYGRYVIPDLPKTTYRVWVRGYGLVDSPKVTTETGKTLNLTAAIAPSPQA